MQSLLVVGVICHSKLVLIACHHDDVWSYCVLTADASRVVLESDDDLDEQGSDYINANFIDVSKTFSVCLWLLFGILVCTIRLDL